MSANNNDIRLKVQDIYNLAKRAADGVKPSETGSDPNYHNYCVYLINALNLIGVNDRDDFIDDTKKVKTLDEANVLIQSKLNGSWTDHLNKLKEIVELINNGNNVQQIKEKINTYIINSSPEIPTVTVNISDSDVMQDFTQSENHSNTDASNRTDASSTKKVRWWDEPLTGGAVTEITQKKADTKSSDDSKEEHLEVGDVTHESQSSPQKPSDSNLNSTIDEVDSATLTEKPDISQYEGLASVQIQKPLNYVSIPPFSPPKNNAAATDEKEFPQKVKNWVSKVEGLSWWYQLQGYRFYFSFSKADHDTSKACFELSSKLFEAAKSVKNELPNLSDKDKKGFLAKLFGSVPTQDSKMQKIKESKTQAGQKILENLSLFKSELDNTSTEVKKLSTLKDEKLFDGIISPEMKQ